LIATDGGSASIWVLSCAALVAIIASVVVLRTGAVLVRHRAEVAADEAALAAAAQIGVTDQLCHSAAVIAQANGARLLHCVSAIAADGRSGTVTVVVGIAVTIAPLGPSMVQASARAGRDAAPTAR
jgi:secretion/DNA translocation related TadE-like protein